MWTVDEQRNILRRLITKKSKPGGKTVFSNPDRALRNGMQPSIVAAIKNPKAIFDAGMIAGEFVATEEGLKIGDNSYGSG